jgi:hypothetical protein
MSVGFCSHSEEQNWAVNLQQSGNRSYKIARGSNAVALILGDSETQWHSSYCQRLTIEGMSTGSHIHLHIRMYAIQINDYRWH